MDFSTALENVIKHGKIAFRDNWNGKGQFICLNKGRHWFNEDQYFPQEGGRKTIVEAKVVAIEGIDANLFERGSFGTTTVLPNLYLMNTNGSMVPWAPSQSDMLAQDWSADFQPAVSQAGTQDCAKVSEKNYNQKTPDVYSGNAKRWPEDNMNKQQRD